MFSQRYCHVRKGMGHKFWLTVEMVWMDCFITKVWPSQNRTLDLGSRDKSALILASLKYQLKSNWCGWKAAWMG